VVIGSDCTGSCKSNYHTITTTTATQYIIESNVNEIYVVITKSMMIGIHEINSLMVQVL
jgi:hypothetical protein